MGDDVERPDSERGARRVALLIFAAAALTALLIYGPGFMVERARRSFAACAGHDEPEPGSDCKRAERWLIFPKLLPWMRAEARLEEQDIEWKSAVAALQAASVVAPNARARKQAADELVALANRGVPEEDDVIDVLAAAGAGEALRDARSLARSARAQTWLLEALIGLGDIDVAHEFAKNPPPLSGEAHETPELDFRRGTLLCLLDDKDAGLVLLRKAERGAAHNEDVLPGDPRIARAACGDHVEPGPRDPDRDAVWSFALGRELSGAALDQRLIGRSGKTTTIQEDCESPFVAAAIVDHEHTLEETLALLGALPGEPHTAIHGSPFSPYAASVGPRLRFLLLLDPERHEKAAERLMAAAKAADKPLSSSVESERLRREMPEKAERTYLELRRKPAVSLLRYAAGFEFESAAAWTGMGNCQRASKAAERGLSLVDDLRRPTSRVIMAELAIACRNFDRAEELLRKVDEDPKSELSARVHLDEALVLAHRGKFADALVQAKRALQYQPSDASEQSFHEEASWLVLALALVTGDLSAAPDLRTPVHEGSDQLPWLRVIGLPEPDRRKSRFRIDGSGTNTGNFVPLLGDAAPATFFVIGQAAQGQDVEVWLDRYFRHETWATDTIGGHRARAEAARWRGDVQSETLELSRSEALQKIATTPNERALATLLGL